MNILYLLVPISLLLVVVVAAAFLWAINNGQFDDPEGPAQRILDDPD